VVCTFPNFASLYTSWTVALRVLSQIPWGGRADASGRVAFHAMPCVTRPAWLSSQPGRSLLLDSDGTSLMDHPQFDPAPRPVLRALICLYIEGRWVWDLVPLTDWDAMRDAYLTAGWWFVALEPDDSHLMHAEMVERSRQLKRR
jgi:hypothetical protein